MKLDENILPILINERFDDARKDILSSNDMMMFDTVVRNQSKHMLVFSRTCANLMRKQRFDSFLQKPISLTHLYYFIEMNNRSEINNDKRKKQLFI